VKVAQAGQTSLTLAATDPDREALTSRIASQPQHGTVGLSGTSATFFAEPGYEGADSFTFAAWGGRIDSNLATVSVTISDAPCQVTCSATVPAAAAEGQSVLFAGTFGGTGCSGTPGVTWTFGDGQTAAQVTASHASTFSGSYGWRLSASADGNVCEQSGTITFTAVPPAITGVKAGGKSLGLTISGSNFQPTAVVSIAGQPWTNVSWTSATQLKVTGGNALKRLFPKNAWVPITVTNAHDGLSVTVEFNRKTKQFRAVSG
jgi:hypothetical protein